jgi:hypothetical protein
VLAFCVAALVLAALGAAFSSWRSGSSERTWLTKAMYAIPLPMSRRIGGAKESIEDFVFSTEDARAFFGPAKAGAATARAEGSALIAAAVAAAERREVVETGVALWAPLLDGGKGRLASAAPAWPKTGAVGDSCSIGAVPALKLREFDAVTNGFECKLTATHAVGRLACCCRDSRADPRAAISSEQLTIQRERPPSRAAFSCFPSLVIAGVQKAGTTALLALLATHPFIVPSVKKETHFFDRFGARGASWYLSLMPPLTDNSGGSLPPSPLVIEATPAYVLGLDTASGLASATAPPRVLVILRDPTSRAWSEYNMKLRRIKTQVSLETTAAESLPAALAPALEAAAQCGAAGLAPLAPLFLKAVEAAVAAAESAATVDPVADLFLDPERDAKIRGVIRKAWAGALPAADARARGAVALRTEENWSELVGTLVALASRGHGTNGVHMGMKALATLFERHWRAASGAVVNATVSCLNKRSLSHPGLAAIFRVSGARDRARECLMGKITKIATAREVEKSSWGGFLWGGEVGEGEVVATAHTRSLAAAETSRTSLTKLAIDSWALQVIPRAADALLRIIAFAASKAAAAGEPGSGDEGALADSAAVERKTKRVRGAAAARASAARSKGRRLLESSEDLLPPEAAVQSLSSCFISSAIVDPSEVRYEAVEAFDFSSADEMDEITKCSSNGVEAGGVNQALGLEAMPASGNRIIRGGAGPRAVLNDGRAGCWPTGSTSNIENDFLYRSIYLQQIFRLHKALGRVS